MLDTSSHNLFATLSPPQYKINLYLYVVIILKFLTMSQEKLSIISRFFNIVKYSERSNTMRNPNGYGSVVKLSGNRRKPFFARKTVGFNDKGHPIYEPIGYYAERKEAMMALAA